MLNIEDLGREQDLSRTRQWQQEGWCKTTPWRDAFNTLLAFFLQPTCSNNLCGPPVITRTTFLQVACGFGSYMVWRHKRNWFHTQSTGQIELAFRGRRRCGFFLDDCLERVWQKSLLVCFHALELTGRRCQPQIAFSQPRSAGLTSAQTLQTPCSPVSASVCTETLHMWFYILVPI